MGSGEVMDNLPAGFVLDSAPDTAGLPPGFQLDQPTNAPPAWKDVLRSLPEQAAAGMENALANIKVLNAREGFLQRQGLSAPGITETPGGAATGIVQPSTIQRQHAAQVTATETESRAEEQVASSNERMKAAAPQNMTYGQQVVSSVAQSAAPTILGLGIGIVTRNPWLAMGVAGGGGAALQGGSTYGEAIEKGASHEEAARAAGIDAILEGVGEAIPLGYALKPTTPLFKRLFGTMAAEAGQEAATQAMQDFHAYLTYDPDITLQEAWTNIKVAAGAGALMGGTVGGVAALADSAEQRREKLLAPNGAEIDTNQLVEALQNDPKYDSIEEETLPPVKTKQPETDYKAQYAALPEPTALEVEQAKARIEPSLTIEALEKEAATPGLRPDTMAQIAELDNFKPVGDLGEIGESRKVARSADEYVNENDLIPRSQREVLYGPGESVGKALGAVALQPGVYAVGTATEDRSARYLKGMTDTLEGWRAKYLPDSTFLLMNESLPTDTATGWHTRLKSGVHVITPAVLRSFTTSKTFNTNAQFKTVVNLSHEFGHGLIAEKFLEGVPPELKARIFMESNAGTISEAAIAQVPNLAEQALLREYNDIKGQLLAGRMTAEEFRLRWMNPAKIHKASLAKEHFVAPNAPAMELVNAIIRRAHRNAVTLNSTQLAKLQAEYTGLNEYLAEQTAKYAFDKRWATSAGLRRLIGEALQSARASLQAFFKGLKGQGIVKPGTKFSEWIEGLSKDPAKTVVEPGPKAKEKVAPPAVKEEPKKEAKPKKEPKAKPVPKKEAVAAPTDVPAAVPEVDHNVYTNDADRQKNARAAVAALVREGAMQIQDPNYKILMGLIKSNDWIAFNDEISAFTGKNASFEIDVDESTAEGRATAQTMYQKFKGFVASPGAFRRTLRFVTNLQYNVLQAQQLAHLNPDDAALNHAAETINNYERYKGRLQALANELADKWGGRYPVLQPDHLSKEQAAKVSQFLQAEMDSGELWAELYNAAPDSGTPSWQFRPNERTMQEMKKIGIDVNTPAGQQTAAFILEVKNSLIDHVNQLEDTLGYLLARRFENAPEKLRDAQIVMKDTFKQIRQAPFFPRGHFGEFMLTVQRKRTSGPGWETVHREAFERVSDRDAKEKEMRSRLKPDERLKTYEVREQVYVLTSLPSDFIELAAAELGVVDPQAIAQLHELAMPVKQEKALSAYDRKRLSIAGGSRDSLRSYSNFMWHNSNVIAKLRHRAEFNYAIAMKRGEVTRLGYTPVTPEVSLARDTARQQLKFLHYVRDTVMNPPSELYGLKSFVALTYLALNPKTALLNLGSMVLTASDLETRYGEVQGMKLFTTAVARTMRSIKPNDLNARRQGDYLPEVIQRGLDRAIQEGQLTQSYAYHLAGNANASNLQRMPGSNMLSRLGKDGMNAAMWMFRLTELANRRATFLAHLDAGLTVNKLTEEQAYQEAVRLTNLLQNDYSVGNRPLILSGATWLGPALPLATVFASFTQFMAFHAFGGYEIGLARSGAPRKAMMNYTIKVALMLMLMAGYEGLPGAENLLDLLDAAWKRFFGESFRVNFRKNLSELVKNTLGEAHDNPSALAHGLGHNFFGFDLSRSVGFGRVFPGTDVVAKSSKPDAERSIGELAISLTGPFGNLVEWAYRTALDPKDGLKRTPGAIGNFINAYKWSEEGVRAPDGGIITRDLKTGELRDLSTFEILGKALGFNPTVVSENRERIFMQHDMRMYWMTRRSKLTKDYWDARLNGDREAMADTRDAIDRFNEEVQDKDLARLRISGKELSRSMKIRERQKRQTEQGLPHEKRYRGLFEDVNEAFGQGLSGGDIP